jgi:hypothetical protein
MRLAQCIFEALVRLPTDYCLYTLQCREAWSNGGSKFSVAFLVTLLSSPKLPLITSEKGRKERMECSNE